MFIDLVHPEDRASLEENSRARRFGTRRPLRHSVPRRAARRDGQAPSQRRQAVGRRTRRRWSSTSASRWTRPSASAPTRPCTRRRAELARVARLTTMGELAASIAHEINQPLAAVVAHGSAALRWLAHDPAQSRGDKRTRSRTSSRRAIAPGKVIGRIQVAAQASQAGIRRDSTSMTPSERSLH